MDGASWWPRRALTRQHVIPLVLIRRRHNSLRILHFPLRRELHPRVNELQKVFTGFSIGLAGSYEY
jgi:hypothetical protein